MSASYLKPTFYKVELLCYTNLGQELTRGRSLKMPEKVTAIIDSPGRHILDQNSVAKIAAVLSLQYRIPQNEVKVCFEEYSPLGLSNKCDLIILVSVEHNVAWPRPEAGLLLRQLAAIPTKRTGMALNCYRVALAIDSNFPTYLLPSESGP